MQIRTSYLIISTGRSGSSLLCEVLKNTGVAGRPGEYFSQDLDNFFSNLWGLSSSNYMDYLDKVIEENTTPNGVFGAKIIGAHFDYFVGKLRENPAFAKSTKSKLISTVFPNLHYIWITRRNKVRQAVSLLKAMQTGVWYLKAGEQPWPVKEPSFDYEAIDHLLQGFVIGEAVWQEYFSECGVRPFTVVYEDFIMSYEDTVSKILKYLGIPVPGQLSLAQPRLQKQADVISEDWCTRYYQIKGEWFAHHKLPAAELPTVLRQA